MEPWASVNTLPLIPWMKTSGGPDRWAAGVDCERSPIVIIPAAAPNLAIKLRLLMPIPRCFSRFILHRLGANYAERIYNSAMSSNVTESLVRLGAEFHRRGWMLGTSGNFSTVVSRDPLRLFITASSMDKGRLTSDHFLEVDQNGVKLNGAAGKPSAETLLHIAVIRATGASAVLHTHSVWSTVLSDFHAPAGGFFIEGYEMLKGLEGVATHEHREWIPILENTQDMKALAAQASGLLQEKPAVHGILIRQHGLYTWGKDLDAAARHIEILEFLFESVGRRRMIGPKPHTKGVTKRRK